MNKDTKVTMEREEPKTRNAVLCEACGQPLRLIRCDEDGDWLAECSDPRCGTLHRGSF